MQPIDISLIIRRATAVIYFNVDYHQLRHYESNFPVIMFLFALVKSLPENFDSNSAHEGTLCEFGNLEALHKPKAVLSHPQLNEKDGRSGSQSICFTKAGQVDATIKVQL
jgi:hypothetical protein